MRVKRIMALSIQAPVDLHFPLTRCPKTGGTDRWRSTRAWSAKIREEAMSLTSRIAEARARAEAQGSDPWRDKLQGLRGRIGDDSIERISTAAIFDILEMPQRRRTAGECRRLAKLMRELGWSPIKARGLNQGGWLDQIRGYARDHTGSPLS
jgi:hypothetical protein